MIYMEGAKMLNNPQELKDIIEETFSNPTIERMMFIETKGKNGEEGKLFPCYLEEYGATEEGEILSFQCSILQSSEGLFGLVRVNLMVSDFNVTKRLWDKPPKKSVRDETPWIEEAVQ